MGEPYSATYAARVPIDGRVLDERYVSVASKEGISPNGDGQGVKGRSTVKGAPLGICLKVTEGCSAAQSRGTLREIL